MADITMCSGTGCPFKRSCYRATATPSSFRQSMFVKPPISGHGCGEYRFNGSGKDASNEAWKEAPDGVDV